MESRKAGITITSGLFHRGKTKETMADGGKVPTQLGPFNTYATRVIPFLADPANQGRLGVSDENKDALVDALGDSSQAGTWISLFALTSDETTSTKPLRNQRNGVQKTITDKLREVYDDIPESALTDADRTTLIMPKERMNRIYP